MLIIVTAYHWSLVREYRERLKAHESDFTETKGFAISPEEMSPKMQQAPTAGGK